MIKELGYTDKKPHISKAAKQPPSRLPQIAFIEGNNWRIISGHTRHSGIGADRMPLVTCPIVDTSQINPQEKVAILRKHICPSGVISTPILLAELISAGGKVLNSKRAA